jgi:hypothetical protein
MHWIQKICRIHFQSRENGQCHVFCSSCPYFEVGAARTVPNSHVIVFCSIPLVFRKSGVLRTVNGAPLGFHVQTRELNEDILLAELL